MLNIVFFIVLIALAVIKFAVYVEMKCFDSRLNTIRSLAEPIRLMYRGQILALYITEETIENQFPSTQISRSSVYINNRLALTVSRLKPMAFIKRSIDVNRTHEYCGDVFKIIKQAGKFANAPLEPG